MDEVAIRVSNVSKTYTNLKAVNNFSLTVAPSLCFGLLGPNGAGKTTMMKMLYGRVLRDDPQQSEISVFGYDPRQHELEIKYFTGIVPQEDNLDNELTVIQNLLIYARFYGISTRVAQERIGELLDFMEISDKQNALIRELSGGMKRRLTIARALLNKPRLLILDEPTTGLDPQVRHAIWDKLRQLKKEGVTILITTHYMEEAFQICDQIIIMHGGQAILEGHPGQLVDKNIEKYVLEILNIEGAAKIRPRKTIRQETGDNRILLYADRLSLLEGITRAFEPGEFYLRQSNLEDLFLKTTGRALND